MDFNNVLEDIDKIFYNACNLPEAYSKKNMQKLLHNKGILECNAVIAKVYDQIRSNESTEEIYVSFMTMGILTVRDEIYSKALEVLKIGNRTMIMQLFENNKAFGLDLLKCYTTFMTNIHREEILKLVTEAVNEKHEYAAKETNTRMPENDSVNNKPNDQGSKKSTAFQNAKVTDLISWLNTLICKEYNPDANVDNAEAFFKDNFKDLLSDEVLTKVYKVISLEPKSTIKKIILLIKTALLFHPLKADHIQEFNDILNISASKIADDFLADKAFGKALINCYIMVIGLGNIQNICNYMNDCVFSNTISAKELANQKKDVLVLDEILMSAFGTMKIAFYQNNAGKNGFIYTMALILANAQIYTNIPGLDDEFATLTTYRAYLLRIIYAEVYRATINGQIILDPEFAEIFMTAIGTGHYDIFDKFADMMEYHEYCKRLLGYFIDAQNVRMPIAPDEDLTVVRKINPLYR